ncbi:transaldolase [Rhodoglobus aureus]|uniref:Transaldolase n=1 Tax=Rhodoglobus aureus TaxID=191497 RepID=A0ABP4G3I0_9MICO
MAIPPNGTERVTAAGVSIWLDDLSRTLLESGGLRDLIAERNVVGVTTNPTIFAAAIGNDFSYQRQVRQLASEGKDVEQIAFRLITDDVRAACDVLRDTHILSRGRDGWVSVEVDPRLAHDADATIVQAQQLASVVDRPNVMIKIPATDEGLIAIRQTIALGISVNVTLIFGVQRYLQVVDAYLSGLEQAAKDGLDLALIHSVASFFVSRVDAEVSGRLGASSPLVGKVAIANALTAYQAFLEAFRTERARDLQSIGANVQRPLWASTAVKNLALPAALYVIGLVAPSTVSTISPATLEAVGEASEPISETIQSNLDSACSSMAKLSQEGVSIADVARVLEAQGVDKFQSSWKELLASVSSAIGDKKQ